MTKGEIFKNEQTEILLVQRIMKNNRMKEMFLTVCCSSKRRAVEQSKIHTKRKINFRSQPLPR